MLVKKETSKLALQKGYTHCTCTCGGYPTCICELTNRAIGYVPARHDEVQKWLREDKALHIDVQHNMHYCWQVRILNIQANDIPPRNIVEDWLIYDHGTYEEALEAGIINALEQLID